MPKTRKDLSCPEFGKPLILNVNVLPTYCDLIKYYLWIKNDLLVLNNAKDPSIKYICKIIATDIEQIWKKSSTSARKVDFVLQQEQEYEEIAK